MHHFRPPFSAKLRVLASVFTEGRDPGEAYDEAGQQKARTPGEAAACAEPPAARPGLPGTAACAAAPACNTTRAEYEWPPSTRGQGAHPGGRYFPSSCPRSGSRRPITGDALSVYRALRFINPSPYMFLLRFGNRFSLVGSSPEVHVRADGRQGGNPSHRRDAPPGRNAVRRRSSELAESLLADPKERAEHLMLVDLARNDVGRIAEYGSGAGDGFYDGRTLQPRHAPRFQRGRAAAPKDSNAFRRDARDFPGGDGQRLAQGARHADHQRPGERASAGVTPERSVTSVSAATWTVASRCARTVLKDGTAYVQAGGGGRGRFHARRGIRGDRQQGAPESLRAHRTGAAHRPPVTHPGAPMLFILDNYDSFTYNLVQYFGDLGAEPLVRRNDEITVAEVDGTEA